MTKSEENPLSGLMRLVGGRWTFNGPEDAPLTYHRYQTKLDGKVIISESFAAAGNKETLVSTSIWYWNPAEAKIKAIGIAQQMEVDVFEYTNVKVEGNTMTCDLSAHSDQGSSEFIEIWEFPDDNSYEWKLFTESPDGLLEVMNGSFARG